MIPMQQLRSSDQFQDFITVIGKMSHLRFYGWRSQDTLGTLLRALCTPGRKEGFIVQDQLTFSRRGAGR